MIAGSIVFAVKESAGQLILFLLKYNRFIIEPYIKMNSKEIAREFARESVKKYADEIVGIVLFGSAARGDDRGESDIDVLVITEGDWYDMLKKLSSISINELLEHGKYISIKTLARDDLKRNIRLETGFIENIKSEGMILYDGTGKYKGALRKSTLQAWCGKVPA